MLSFRYDKIDTCDWGYCSIKLSLRATNFNFVWLFVKFGIKYTIINAGLSRLFVNFNIKYSIILSSMSDSCKVVNIIVLCVSHRVSHRVSTVVLSSSKLFCVFHFLCQLLSLSSSNVNKWNTRPDYFRFW